MQIYPKLLVCVWHEMHGHQQFVRKILSLRFERLEFFFVYSFYLALARLLVYFCIFTVILFIHFSLMTVFFLCVLFNTYHQSLLVAHSFGSFTSLLFVLCSSAVYFFPTLYTFFALHFFFLSYRLFVLLIYSWKKHISLDANTRQNNIAWYIISLLTQLFGIHQVEPINYYKSVCVSVVFFLFHFIA